MNLYTEHFCRYVDYDHCDYPTCQLYIYLKDHFNGDAIDTFEFMNDVIRYNTDDHIAMFCDILHYAHLEESQYMRKALVKREVEYMQQFHEQ